MTRVDAAQLFESALRWLQGRYSEYRFFTERDIVWTVQLRLIDEIERAGLPYRIFSDHTISGRTRADLAILDGESVEVAAEFKYEPSHERRSDRGGDIWASKLNPSVVFWTGEGSVERDVQRLSQYVDGGSAKAAFSVFIDEGGRFRHRDPHGGSEWIDWGHGVWALWSKTGPPAGVPGP